MKFAECNKSDCCQMKKQIGFGHTKYIMARMAEPLDRAKRSLVQ